MQLQTTGKLHTSSSSMSCNTCASSLGCIAADSAECIEEERKRQNRGVFNFFAWLRQTWARLRFFVLFSFPFPLQSSFLQVYHHGRQSAATGVDAKRWTLNEC